jgi:hypothetical protein
MIELGLAAAITVSISGVSYAALNPQKLEADARAVANQATCRTVDSAIVAYVGVHGEAPRTVRELREYVKGDISRYRIVDGMAAGPGC